VKQFVKCTTGAEVAAIFAAGRRVLVTRGRDCYQPETRTIFLSEQTYRGTDAGAIYRALHEAAHARQHAGRPVLFALRNAQPIRLWLERDAWRQAAEWMRKTGLDPEAAKVEETRCLRSYSHRGAA